MELPYHPLNFMFVSMVFAIKLQTVGVDCSIISYAGQGKPFKCRRPIPIDDILNTFAPPETNEDPDDAYSWLKCGAHQVEIPSWILDKEELVGYDIREANATVENEQYDDFDEFPNPDEIYSIME